MNSEAVCPACEVHLDTISEVAKRCGLLEAENGRLEAIVRALAESDPVMNIGCHHDDHVYVCGFCPEGADDLHNNSPNIPLERHAEICVWRQAVVWTQQQ